MNDLMILKFRGYHYKEFIKIFANNFYSEKFEGTSHSFYAMMLLPTVTMTVFNLFNPFSVFRRILVVSSLFGSTFSLILNLKDELGDIASKDPGPLGEIVRYRF